jgi:hypothetical protein
MNGTQRHGTSRHFRHQSGPLLLEVRTERGWWLRHRMRRLPRGRAGVSRCEAPRQIEVRVLPFRENSDSHSENSW